MRLGNLRNVVFILLSVLPILVFFSLICCENRGVGGDDDNENGIPEDDDTGDDDDIGGDDDTGGDDDDDDTGVAPYVLSTLPEDGDDQLRLATVVIVAFSKPMDQESVEDNFSMPGVSGSFSWNGNGDEVTFTPSGILDEDKDYTVFMGAGSEDLAGNPMEGQHAFLFSTVDLWTRTYNGAANDDDRGVGIAVDDDFNVYVIGWETVTGEGLNIWFRKYDKHGTEQWTRTYNGTDNLADSGFDVAVDMNGNPCVNGGETVTGEGGNIWVRKYDADGEVLWTRTHNGEADGSDGSRGIAVDGIGNIYVAGLEAVTGESWNIWVRKYDADGAEQWTRTYNGEANDLDGGWDIAVDASGNAYVTGWERMTSENPNIWIRKYDTDGAEKWTRTYDGEANAADTGRDIDVDGDGNVYVVGSVTVTDENLNLWVRKYDTDGTEQWTNIWNGESSGHDHGLGIAVDLSGNVYVSGTEFVAGEDLDVIIRKYDTNGTELWTQTHSEPDSGYDQGHDIAVDGHGNVYVTGFISVEGEDRNIWIRKYDTDGNWAE